MILFLLNMKNMNKGKRHLLEISGDDMVVDVIYFEGSIMCG